MGAKNNSPPLAPPLSVWTNKDVPQAWHEPATTYINMSLLLLKSNQAVEESMAFESMAFWLNHCTLSMRCANANSISRRRRKQKIRDLRHLTF